MWQTMEREVNDALAKRECREFDSAGALIGDLHAQV